MTGSEKEEGDKKEEEEEVEGEKLKIGLEDHTRPLHTNGRDERRGGIEACVGNTPLIRIGSLSRETGCEILGKVEVSS